VQQIRRPVMLVHPKGRCLHNNQSNVWWRWRE